MATTTNYTLNTSALLIALKKHGFTNTQTKAGKTIDNQLSNGVLTVTTLKNILRLEHANGQKQEITIAKATDKSVLPCINSLAKSGQVTPHNDVETVPAPVTTPAPATTQPRQEVKKMTIPNTATVTTDDQLLEGWESPKEKLAKEKTGKKEEKPKITPVMPENPAGDATPVFDELFATCEKIEELDAKKNETWAALAKKYDYSIVNITKSLHAEGKWPSKLDKEGKPIADKETGIIQPMGYQAVYKAERVMIEQGKGEKGIGHMVNTAAAAFGRAKREAGLTPASSRSNSGIPAGGKTPSTPAPGASTDDKIIALEQIIKSMTDEDVLSWLDSSARVSKLVDIIVDTRMAVDVE